MKEGEKAVKACPGGGRAASIDNRTGFYACPVCSTVLGVVLAPMHRTPEHVAMGAGMVPIPEDAQRYRVKPEHNAEPVLVMAEKGGFPKDWVIDLLYRALLITRHAAQEQVNTAPPPRIVLTGFDAPTGKPS